MNRNNDLSKKGGRNRNSIKDHHRQNGGMASNSSCGPNMHMMPDGTCMEGAYHGASTSRMGSRMSSGYQRGGRARRRFQQGGHAHTVNAMYLHHPVENHRHALSTDYYSGNYDYDEYGQIMTSKAYMGTQQGGHGEFEYSPEGMFDGEYYAHSVSWENDQGAHNHPGRSRQMTRRRGGSRTSNSIQGICPPGFVLQGGSCVPKWTTTQEVMSNCPPGQHLQNDGSCGPLRPSTGPTMPYRRGGRVRGRKNRGRRRR